MEYSELVIEHFQNPRNVGVIEDADGVGKMGSPICGDLMEIYGRTSIVIGMRLHSLLLACLAGKPFVAIPPKRGCGHDPKIEGFLESLAVDAREVSIEGLNAGDGAGRVCGTYARRKEFFKGISSALERMKMLSESNYKYLITGARQ